ncbi:uncharacterized protein EV420DRAFT_1472666 [Desarmillaria tabescens]|uniref:Uncharacterized protein n=1 Tax=Armillaria tabescens TaxID=1929756 RepID=A0AA39NPH1_ARMTA|nr:uncharacterized protein EV420DRAFT_1472666 [Desarmillaria tabescens]KAK0469432.1 hypothetical protein EV420DRAFT_1472666 [Desarmillaria tabescens]
MNFDWHITEVTVIDLPSVITHFQSPAHHDSRALPVTIQWQHENADPSTLGPVIGLLANVQTIIFWDTCLSGPISLLNTTVQEVVLLDCSMTQEALLGLLTPWGSLSISGGRTRATVGPSRDAEDLILQTLYIDFQDIPPHFGYSLYSWLSTASKVRNLYVRAELDMDTVIVQGFLDQWYSDIKRFKMIQAGCCENPLWTASILDFQSCHRLTELNIQCRDTELVPLTSSLATFPARQLEIVTIGFHVKSWADKTGRWKYSSAIREFDAHLFRLIDHSKFIFLRLQLGSHWVEKDDEVAVFVRLNMLNVMSLAPSKLLFHWHFFNTSKFIKICGKFRTACSLNGSLVSGEKSFHGIEGLLHLDLSTDVNTEEKLCLPISLFVSMASNEVTVYNHNEPPIFVPKPHPRPITEIVALHPFQKSGSIVHIRTGSVPLSVISFLAHVVEIAEDAKSVFKMKVSLVVYLSDFVTYHAKSSDIEYLIHISAAVPWFEAWYEARTMFPFDWLEPYLRPGSIAYTNTPIFIHEGLQQVTHVVVLTTFLLPGYDHPVTALSHVLVEWAQIHLTRGVTLHGLAYETVSSKETPYCTAILLIKADVSVPTDTRASETSYPHPTRMHLGTDASRTSGGLNIRNYSNAMRTAANLLMSLDTEPYSSFGHFNLPFLNAGH